MLKYRLPTGIAIGLLVLASIFLNDQYAVWIFSAIGGALAYLAADEYLAIIGKLGLPSFRNVTASAAALILILKVFETPLAFSIFMLSFIAMLSWLSIIFADKKQNLILRMVGSFSVFPMLVLPLYFLASIYTFNGGHMSGKLYFLYLILVTKLGDVGAYSFGMASSRLLPAGNHKIFPKISPKKSWEGTIGGLFTSVAASIVFCHFMPQMALGFNSRILFASLLGAVLFIGGFAGDLAESALKRSADVKDSGSTLPGMGGALDVLDSLLVNSPIFYFFIIISL